MPPDRTPRVLHAALWVTDWEATRAFYVDLLGLDVTREAVVDGVRNYLVAGPDGAELQFKRAPDGEVPDPAGVDHVAVAVEDVDATFERLTAAGAPAVADPWTMDETGNRVAFVADPDGYVVELVGRPPAPE